MNPVWLHWWAGYTQIPLPANACPLSPSGTADTATAVVDSSQWVAHFNAVLIATLVVAVIAVVITYQTRTMGEAFVRRWRRSLFLTAAITAVLALVFLATVAVQTYGCTFGVAPAKIPLGHAMGRATVAFVQSGIAFFVFSLFLTRYARITRHEPWHNHSRVPISW
jgi:heme/copper-type cytochrome/quinol oxidase subunit 1